MTDPRHDLPADHGADETLDPALLADLRQAWTELPAPEAAPELEDADPLTREVVAWMADAYRAQQPAVSGPSLPARHRWHQGWRRWRRHAVAAALLIGLGLAVASWPGSGAPAGVDGPDTVADGAEPTGPRHTGPAEDLPGARPDRDDALVADGSGQAPPPAPNDPLTAPAVDEPRLVAVADDHVSFRAGAVRLVLITNPASAE